MHTLSTLFPAAFPALALSHFVALLSPGPDFFLLVGYAVRYRIRGSIGLCLGIAAVYCSRHRRLGASAPGAAAVFAH